jgi:site-specific recombinase XerD
LVVRRSIELRPTTKEAAMGELRQRMSEELRVRGYAERTVTGYVGQAARFVKRYRKDPRELGMEDIRRYLVEMTEREKLSSSTVNQAIHALRFLYVEVLGREWTLGFRIQRRRHKAIRRVLDREELERLFASIGSLKHRTIAMVLYGAGLRLREALHLHLGDIDSRKMRILVREAKGGRERYVMLSRRLLRQLREYYVEERPREILFPGQDQSQPLNPSSVQKVIRRAGKAAKIPERVTPHVLRHCFATHLIDSGASLPYVQQLLGHKSVGTTMLYTHVAASGPTRLTSPLDVAP